MKKLTKSDKAKSKSKKDYSSQKRVKKSLGKKSKRQGELIIKALNEILQHKKLNTRPRMTMEELIERL